MRKESPEEILIQKCPQPVKVVACAEERCTTFRCKDLMAGSVGKGVFSVLKRPFDALWAGK